MQISQGEFSTSDGVLIVSPDGIKLAGGLSLTLSAPLLVRALKAYTRHAGFLVHPNVSDDADRWRRFREAIAAD